MAIENNDDETYDREVRRRERELEKLADFGYSSTLFPKYDVEDEAHSLLDDADEPEALIVDEDRVLTVSLVDAAEVKPVHETANPARRSYSDPRKRISEETITTGKKWSKVVRAELEASEQRAKDAEAAKKPPRRVPPSNWRVAR